ncbi:hypothetical protein B0A51_18483, partial [Rachicladosporium sp. CCFEE 5018]
MKPPRVARTPSLVSGSSASEFDSPRAHGLRRKPSSIDQYAAQRRAAHAATDPYPVAMHHSDRGVEEDFEDSVLGISIPAIGATSKSRRVSASEYASRLGLPPVRESSTSSSNSTVKASQPTATGWTKDRTTITEVSKSQGKVNAAISKAGVPSRSATTVQRKPVGDSTSTHRTIVVPPELAHLNVETPARNDRQKPLPPLRPSRDNTPSLTNVNCPSPVVQSDLPKVYATYHK